MTAKRIKMQPLERVSPSIAAAGYDGPSQTLAVEFKESAGTFHYHGVGVDIFAKLLTAIEPQQLLQAAVVGKYKQERV